MTALRTLLMLLGALGVLMLGAVSPASAEAGPPPCHLMADGHSNPHGSTPERAPMKSMACCIACIAAPAITPPMRTGVALRRPTPQAVAPMLPAGRRLTPETGPPKG